MPHKSVEYSSLSYCVRLTMPGPRSRLKEAFGEKPLPCDIPVLKPMPELLGQGVLVTTRKIVVSIPDPHFDANNYNCEPLGIQNTTPAIGVRNFVDLQPTSIARSETSDPTQKRHKFYLPAPNSTNNLVQMSPNSDPGGIENGAAQSQQYSDLSSGNVNTDEPRNGLIKVRKKDPSRQDKRQGNPKSKQHRRSQARMSNARMSDIESETEEFPFNAYDSVESMVAKDGGYQSDFLLAREARASYQANAFPDPNSSASFLPKLCPDSVLPKQSQGEPHLPEGVEHERILDKLLHPLERSDQSVLSGSTTSLPPVTKQSNSSAKDGGEKTEKKKHRRRKKKGDDADRRKSSMTLDEEPDILLKPEVRKEEVRLGGRTILVAETNLSLTTVIRHQDKPKSQPLTLMFEYPKNYLTHRYVLDMVKNQIHSVPYGYVMALQFQDCNVRRSTEGLLNRWLVTVSCPEARDQLLRTGIKLFNRKIQLRRYDDILDEEYKSFNVWIKHVKEVLGDGEDDELLVGNKSDDQVGEGGEQKPSKSKAR